MVTLANRAWAMLPLAIAMVLQSCHAGVPLHDSAVIHIPEATGTARAEPPAMPSTEAPVRREPRLDARERDEVRRATEAIYDLRPALHRCFLAHHPNFQQRRVVIEFTLQRDGRASGVKLRPASAAPQLLACLERVVSNASFEPRALGTAVVRVPLKLGAP